MDRIISNSELFELTYKNKPSKNFFEKMMKEMNDSNGGLEIREISPNDGSVDKDLDDKLNQISNIIHRYLKPNWFDYGYMIITNQWEICIEMKKPKDIFKSPKWEVFDSFDEVLKYLIGMLRDTSIKRYLRLLKHKPQYKSIILN